LLAIPENLVLLSQDEFGNVIIPCRPTSPDVNVTLIKDEEEVRFQSWLFNIHIFIHIWWLFTKQINWLKRTIYILLLTITSVIARWE